MFSNEFKAKIKESYSQLKNLRAVARNFNVSHQTVKYIVESNEAIESKVSKTSSALALPGKTYKSQRNFTSDDWYAFNADSNSILNQEDEVSHYVTDKITLNWSPICEIVWTRGKKLLQCLDSNDEKYKSLDDISVQMRHKAITDYGMIVEDGPHHQRGDDSDLIGLLRWVRLAKSLDVSNKQSKIKQTSTSQNQQHRQDGLCNEILGVGTLIRSSGKRTPSRVAVRTINWTGFQTTQSYLNAPIRIQVYHSDMRSRALVLCDWVPDIDNVSQVIPLIDYLEKEGNYMRAAAIAVFNMRLQRAIESLTKGAKKGDANLSSVAMALSGYTAERSSIWREMCQNLKNQLDDPYMKAMFAFLTCDNDSSFSEIIHDQDLILVDRVAFSLLYLPDDKLNVYLSETMSTLVANGDLNGILLTGITTEGLNLLQRYIETSSDIQSVSLIMLHSLPSAICNEDRPKLWVECYRGMLDCWRLWHHRAKFDNLWYSNAANTAKAPIHILINCKYCGNSINKSSHHQHISDQQFPSQLHLQSTTAKLFPPPAAAHNIPNTTSTSGLSSMTAPASTTTSISYDQANQNQQSESKSTSGQQGYSNPVSISGANSVFSSNSFSSNSSPSTMNSTLNQANAAIPCSNSSHHTTVYQSNSSTPTLGGGIQARTSIVPITTVGRIKPACKKCSYAKCCLCLTQLGSNVVTDFRVIQPSVPIKQISRRVQPLGSNKTNISSLSQETTNNSINPMSNWFSWCQTCRHGAHSAHLLSWFKENSECPVSGCSCKCMNLDAPTQLNIKTG